MSIAPEVKVWLENTQDPGILPSKEVYLSQAEVKDLITKTPKEVALIDLRKADFVGGKIKGALNLPAQGIQGSIEDLYDLYKSAGKKEVVVYCRSSRDRATRVWGWFEKLVKEKGDEDFKPYILTGGFTGWVAQGQEYIDLVEDYVPQN